MAEFIRADMLPPFSGDSGCPKCTYSRVEIIFHDGHADGYPCKTPRARLIGGHLCRVCEQCGHGWCEATADVPRPGGAAPGNGGDLARERFRGPVGPGGVSVRISGWLSGAGPVPVTVDLSYAVSAPYEVTAVFDPDADRPVRWVLARSLLEAGLRGGPAGEADVRAWAVGSGQVLAVELDSPYGHAVIEFPAGHVREFLTRTRELVPRGAERVDIDAVVGGLLAPRRIRRRRDRGWRMPPGTIYVGRPGRWGNPFGPAVPVSRDHPLRRFAEQALTAAGLPVTDVIIPGSAQIAVAAYRHWLTGWPGMLADARRLLTGHDLACWCPLPEQGQPDVCHAAVLLDLVNGTDAEDTAACGGAAGEDRDTPGGP